eukprot:681297-Amphidinium_carterae.1
MSWEVVGRLADRQSLRVHHPTRTIHQFHGESSFVFCCVFSLPRKLVSFNGLKIHKTLLTTQSSGAWMKASSFLRSERVRTPARFITYFNLPDSVA